MFFYIKKKHEAQAGSSSFKQSKPTLTTKEPWNTTTKKKTCLTKTRKKKGPKNKAEGEEGEVCHRGDASDIEQAKKKQEEWIVCGVV